jgi:hypothetical protein
VDLTSPEILRVCGQATSFLTFCIAAAGTAGVLCKIIERGYFDYLIFEQACNMKKIMDTNLCLWMVGLQNSLPAT